MMILKRIVSVNLQTALYGLGNKPLASGNWHDGANYFDPNPNKLR